MDSSVAWNINAMDKIIKIDGSKASNYDRAWRTIFVNKNINECKTVDMKINSHTQSDFMVMIGLGNV